MTWLGIFKQNDTADVRGVKKVQSVLTEGTKSAPIYTIVQGGKKYRQGRWIQRDCCFSSVYNLIIKGERFQPVVLVAVGSFFSLSMQTQHTSTFHNAAGLTHALSTFRNTQGDWSLSLFFWQFHCAIVFSQFSCFATPPKVATLFCHPPQKQRTVYCVKEWETPLRGS